MLRWERRARTGVVALIHSILVQAIGIDIGGTKIAGAVVDERGDILVEDRVATEAGDSEAIVEAVIAMIRKLAVGRSIAAAGVAAPGFIDADQSTVYYTPNISWRNEPLRERLRESLDLDITIDNDANAAGWAEFQFGAGRDVRDMTMLTIGTGVGGAIVSRGTLFRGGFGAGAELGHLRLVPDGLPCGCGARGCIEQYGSGRALLRIANEIADAGGVGLALAAGPRIATAARSTVTSSATSSPRTTRARCAPSSSSATRSGRPARASRPCSTPSCSCSAGESRSPATCCSTRCARRSTRTCRRRDITRSPGSWSPQLANDAGMVGAADLARIHSQQH